MASLRTRTRGDGTQAHQVLHRVDGIQTGDTFDDLAVARQFKTYLDGGVSRDEAMRLLGQAQARGDAGPVLLDDFVEAYIEHLTGVTDGTRDGYRGIYRRAWQPRLGKLPLDALTRDRVALVVNELAATRITVGKSKGRTLSHKTIANAHGLLSAVLEEAVEQGLLPKNPSKGMRLPRGAHDKVEPTFLTRAEFEQLHAATKAAYRPLVLTLAGTGLRWGEATALPVANVDLNACTLRVTQAWKTGTKGRQWVLGTPKTQRSRRTVSLPQGVVEALAPLIEGRAPDDLVFVNGRGNPVRPQAFHTNVWAPAIDGAGLARRPRIHDLRHSHASWLIAAGVHLGVISRRLGHEDIRTTMNVYGHLMPDLQREAAAAADAVFSGARQLE